ncbi:MAG: response regulator [Candidatus Latescibacteria bacterium]|jgi:two-component system, OmpR family, response regulator|nr:response regulator [Candidatus Latescibacterota bacterium]
MENFDILIVDDDPINLEIIRARLKGVGYTFDTASNGAEALEKIAVHHFDVVLTDLMMPEVDGMDLLAAVKKQRPQTEVIIMTAYATVDNAVQALLNGAVDYLQKPINLEELYIKLNKLMLVKSLTRSTDELQTAMDVTERSASETIKNLEDMVIGVQRRCAQAIDTLLDERTDITERIARAVEVLKEAR